MAYIPGCEFCDRTGCEFSVVQKLLVEAQGVGNSDRREQSGQKNAYFIAFSGRPMGLRCEE